MTPTQILALINTQIVSNGIGAITGPILNAILTAMVNLFSTVSLSAARIVNTSTPLNVLTTDFAIGLQRTFGLAPITINLPVTPVGQEYVIQDLSGNLNAFPATVVPPVGQAIVGLANFVMNEDRQTTRFRYFGSNIWGVE